MNNLYVQGNLILDKIYFIENFLGENQNHSIISNCRRWGGIGNFYRQFINLQIENIEFNFSTKINKYHFDEVYSYFKDCSKEIQTSCSNSSVAQIIINASNGNRTSFVNWGVDLDLYPKQIFKLPGFNNTWLHFMYLDKLNNFSKEYFKILKESGYIISADLCNVDRYNVNRIIECLPYLNYLIISNTERSKLPIEKITCDLIIHQKEYTTIHSKNNKIKKIENNYYNDEQKIKHTLGAGDVYSCTFICNMLQGYELEESIKKAHQESTNYCLRGLNV